MPALMRYSDEGETLVATGTQDELIQAAVADHATTPCAECDVQEWAGSHWEACEFTYVILEATP